MNRAGEELDWVELEAIRSNLDAACQQRDPGELPFVLFQITMRGWQKRDFVSKAFVEHALDLEKAQKFLGAGIPVDTTFHNRTPLSVALLDGAVEEVVFYLKHGADPNRTLGDVDNWFYAAHSVRQNTAKMRELLLAGAESKHVVWWNSAWFLPWSPVEYSQRFPQGVDHLALQWLRENRGKRDLELLAQDDLYDRVLDHVLRYASGQNSNKEEGGFLARSELLLTDISRALLCVPRGSLTGVLLQDSLQPWSRKTAYTFGPSFHAAVKQVGAMNVVSADVLDIVFAYCDRHSW